MCKKTITFLFASLLSLAFFSCSDDNDERYIWDVNPYCINVLVQDSEGNDLLGDCSKIEYEYNGDIYTVNDATRALPAEFYGLCRFVNKKGSYFLSFGEFDGDKDVTDEEIIIHWGDGTSDCIQFSNDCNIKGKNLEIERVVKLNGKVVDNGPKIESDAIHCISLSVLIVK